MAVAKFPRPTQNVVRDQSVSFALTHKEREDLVYLSQEIYDDESVSYTMRRLVRTALKSHTRKELDK